MISRENQRNWLHNITRHAGTHQCCWGAMLLRHEQPQKLGQNETRTISCNVLIISDLKEIEKTSGETEVKLSWLFWTYWKSDLYGHLTPKRRVLWPSNTRSYSCKSAHSWLNNDDLRLKRLEIEPYMLSLWAGRKSQYRFRPWMDWGLGPLLSGEEEETGKSEFIWHDPLRPLWPVP